MVKPTKPSSKPAANNALNKAYNEKTGKSLPFNLATNHAANTSSIPGGRLSGQKKQSGQDSTLKTSLTISSSTTSETCNRPKKLKTKEKNEEQDDNTSNDEDEEIDIDDDQAAEEINKMFEIAKSKKEKKLEKAIEKSKSINQLLQSNNDSFNSDIERLTAIKFFISEASVEQYKNPINLQKEIKRCKLSKEPLMIKFAELKKNIVVIATDCKETHDILTEEWPKDAFGKGVRFLKKFNKNTTRNIIIKGIHREIDVEDQEIINQLKEQGIVNAKRIINKDNERTTVAKAIAEDFAIYKKALRSGIHIGYSRHRVEAERTVLQCFNCQKTGHSSFNCKNKLACLKCGESHTHKECNAQELKCVNCGEEHTACSRTCKFLIEASQQTKMSQLRKQQHQKPTFAISSTNQQTRTYASVAKNDYQQPRQQKQIVQEDLENKIEKLVEIAVEKKLNEYMNNITKQISEQVNSILEKSIGEIIKKKIDECLIGPNITENLCQKITISLKKQFEEYKQTTNRRNSGASNSVQS